MVSITTHRDRQAVQQLAFCYLCTAPFESDEARHRDHVPPKTCFAVRDREPLILPSHYACNSGRSVTDKQIGQIIGLKHGKLPSPRDRALKINYVGPGVAAVMNVDIRGEIWRWVKGFHAALYQQPYPLGARGAMTTPFPSAPIEATGRIALDPVPLQHAVFVETIKLNRAKGKLDVIRCNRGKLVYECVWCPSDDGSAWLCIFAIDIYGWKDLGNSVVQAARGCAGFYTLPDRSPPPTATKGATSSILVPNFDPLDPFGL